MEEYRNFQGLNRGDESGADKSLLKNMKPVTDMEVWNRVME